MKEQKCKRESKNWGGGAEICFPQHGSHPTIEVISKLQ